MIKKICPFIFLVSIFVLSACDAEIPIKEMTKARDTITQAQEVKADTYSKENLDKAISHLTASHDQCMDKDVKKAKKSAEDAVVAAQKAIDESWPLLSADTLELAKSTSETAKDFNAEEYAKAPYDEALKLIEESDQLNTEENYQDSYATSNKSIESSEKAIEGCKARIPEIKKSLDGVTNKKNDIAGKSQNPEVMEILKSAQANIDNANSSIEDGKLIVANQAIKDADESLVKAQLLVDIDNKMKEVDALRAQVDELKKSDAASFAQNEISATTASLDKATASAQSKDLNQTTENANAASKSLEEAKQKIAAGQAATKKVAEVKASANDFFKQLPKDENRFDNQVSQINSQLSQADQALGKKDAPGALSAANSADSGIGSLKTAYTAYLAEQAKAAEEESKRKEAEEAEALAVAAAAAAAEAELESLQTVSDSKDGKAVKGERGEGTIYVVKYTPPDHDALWRISWKLYRDASLWPLIFMENKDQIKNPDLIFPGQQFVIPALDDDMNVNREEARKIRNEAMRNR